ncbi:MAG: Fic family protein [Pseudomonadota bacterium]
MTTPDRLAELIVRIEACKVQIDHLRPLATQALQQLRKYYDVELTYTSNAIEGNTLTLRETAEVIEYGITTGGKTLREHLEAADHYQAVLWMRDLASKITPISVNVVCELHRRMIVRSQPEIAGIYSTHPRRIAGSRAVFPNPVKIPALMQAFGVWLEQSLPTPAAAFEAHYRLVAIHPFSDGNGRTARLLMNLLLIRNGYPPVAVRPEDRGRYLDALETAHGMEDLNPFQIFLHERLDSTLSEYLSASQEAISHE